MGERDIRREGERREEKEGGRYKENKERKTRKGV